MSIKTSQLVRSVETGRGLSPASSRGMTQLSVLPASKPHWWLCPTAQEGLSSSLGLQPELAFGENIGGKQ